MPDLSAETIQEISKLTAVIADKFSQPELIPGCEVMSVADKDLYASENGWVEAVCGRHNQQRCRWKGKFAGIQVGDYVDVLYFSSIKSFEVLARGGVGDIAPGASWPFAHVYTVSQTTLSADFSDIQAAINAAADGDAILIDAGTWTLTATLTINKAVTLIGLGRVIITYDTSPTIDINAAAKFVYLTNLVGINTDDTDDSVALQITASDNGKALHCEFIGRGAGSVDNCIGVNMATSTIYTFEDTTMLGEDGTVSAVGLKTDGTAYVKNSVIDGGSVGLYIDTNGSVTINNDTQVVGGITNNGVLTGSYIDAGNNVVIVAGDELKTNTINETTAAAGVTIDGVLLQDNFGKSSAWAYWVKNTSGAAAAVNDIGYINEDGEYKTTTTAYLDAEWCVVLSAGGNNTDIYIARGGRVNVNYTGAAPAAKDYLVTSTTAGSAQTQTTMRPEVFAVCLGNGSGGVVSALLLCGTRYVPKTSTNFLYGNNNHSAYTWSGTINGAPTATTVVYTTAVGNADTLTPVTTTILGKLRIYNSTRGTYRILTNNVVGTLTMTTVNSVDAWANGDTITAVSPTVVSALAYKAYEIDLTQQTDVPALARAVAFTLAKTDTGSGATYSSFVHPYESYSLSKLSALCAAQPSGLENQSFGIVPIIDKKFALLCNASGSSTASDVIYLNGYLVASSYI